MEKTPCWYKVAGDLTEFLKMICMFVSAMSLVLDCIMYKDDPNYLITVTILQCTDVYATAPTCSVLNLLFSFTGFRKQARAS